MSNYVTTYDKMADKLFESTHIMHESLSFTANMMCFVAQAWALTNDMAKGVIPNDRATIPEKVRYFEKSVVDLTIDGGEINKVIENLRLKKPIDLSTWKVSLYGVDELTPEDGEMYYYDALPANKIIGVALLSRLLRTFELFYSQLVLLSNLKGKDDKKWKEISGSMKTIIKANLFHV